LLDDKINSQYVNAHQIVNIDIEFVEIAEDFHFTADAALNEYFKNAGNLFFSHVFWLAIGLNQNVTDYVPNIWRGKVHEISSSCRRVFSLVVIHNCPMHV